MAEANVTDWIRGVEAGDPAAAEALWARYYEKLVRMARRKLNGTPRRVADEEDVVLSAFHSFCRAAREGRFPHLADRNDLWRLLIKMTARKAVDLIRYNDREKRRVRGQSALPRRGADDPAGNLDDVIGDSPTPELAAQLVEQCRHLLRLLGDADLEQVAVAKMEGRSNVEIAGKLDCSVRTVERQLNLIRKKWEGELKGGQSG